MKTLHANLISNFLLKNTPVKYTTCLTMCRTTSVAENIHLARWFVLQAVVILTYFCLMTLFLSAALPMGGNLRSLAFPHCFFY